MNKFLTFTLLFIMTIFISLPSWAACTHCNTPCNCNCPCCEKVQPNNGVSSTPCPNKEHCKDCMNKEKCCENCPCCKEQKTDK